MIHLYQGLCTNQKFKNYLYFNMYIHLNVYSNIHTFDRNLNAVLSQELKFKVPFWGDSSVH